MVIDQDQSAESRTFIAELENTETFAIHSYQSNLDLVEPEFEKNNLNAVIIIPADFSEDLMSADGQAELMAILNGSESVTATVAMRTLDGLVSNLNNDLALKKLHLSEDVFADQASLRGLVQTKVSAMRSIPSQRKWP